MNVEVCSSSIESVIIANSAGADRIELCSGLSVGGLSPSKGLIELALKKSKIPIHCLIRPREGHFIYNKNDFETILYDVRYMKKMGVTGIVVGMINEDHDINSEQLNEVIKEASGIEITFHRAFDCLKDPKKNILKLSSMGVSRILTSGGSKSAIKGINNLIKWKLLSNNLIEIQPGGGINLKNIMNFKDAGFSSIHLSGTINSIWNQSYPKNIDKTFYDQKIRIPSYEIIKKIVNLAKYPI